MVSFNLAADQNWRMSGIASFPFIGEMAKPAEPAGGQDERRWNGVMATAPARMMVCRKEMHRKNRQRTTILYDFFVAAVHSLAAEM